MATSIFAACLVWQVGGERSVTYISDAGTVSASLIASLACFRVGWHHEGRWRLSWWLLAAACGAWMLGEVIWTAYDVAGGEGPPIPSWADVGYLSFIPLAVAALLYHPGLRGSGMRKARSLIDSLSIAVALLFLSWVTVLGALWRDSDLTTLGGVVTLAYPVGDVVIAFFVLIALRRMGSAERVGLWCLLAGLIALALADSAYAYVVEVAQYSTGNLLDVGWFAGFLGIALGAFASDGRDVVVRAESSLSALPSLIAPLAPMFVALCVAGIRMTLGHRPDRVAVAMLLALILLTFVRQALLLFDLFKSGHGERQDRLLDRMAGARFVHSGSEVDANIPTSDPRQ